MKKEPIVFVGHILDAIQKIEKYMKKYTKEKFIRSGKTQDSVIRNLEIIGEATKNISLEFREKYNEVPWSQMAKFRDVLIHQYFGVDINVAWDVTIVELPEIKEKIKKIIEFEKKK